MEEFHLKSELLLQAFWGGYMCNKNCLKRCQGYFNADVSDFGRGIIEYCVAKNFNIHRVPGYGQYYIKDGTVIEMLHEYGDLSEADIEVACAEIMELYRFTQKELAKSKYVKDGKVRLVRSLRPFEIEVATSQLKEPDNSKIIIPTNIMTSYAHDGELFCYGSKMSIVREVPVEKIIMFDECLYHPQNACANNIHGGEYEVWVMEDNIFGKLELDRGCFVYRTLENKEKYDNYFTSKCFMPRYAIDSSLYTDERKITKPCEWNWFTKWLIKRNVKEIRELYGFSMENTRNKQ